MQNHKTNIIDIVGSIAIPEHLGCVHPDSQL